MLLAYPCNANSIISLGSAVSKALLESLHLGLFREFVDVGEVLEGRPEGLGCFEDQIGADEAVLTWLDALELLSEERPYLFTPVNLECSSYEGLRHSPRVIMRIELIVEDNEFPQ